VQSLFGIQLPQAAQYLLAFAIVIGLVALFGLLLRRLTGGRLRMSGANSSRARQPRLGIVDIYDLDRQRQLVLLRRDNTEHLLMIGGPNDIVVETNIMRVAARAMAPTADAERVSAQRTGSEAEPETMDAPEMRVATAPRRTQDLPQPQQAGAIESPPTATIAAAAVAGTAATAITAVAAPRAPEQATPPLPPAPVLGVKPAPELQEIALPQEKHLPHEAFDKIKTAPPVAQFDAKPVAPVAEKNPLDEMALKMEAALRAPFAKAAPESSSPASAVMGPPAMTGVQVAPASKPAPSLDHPVSQVQNPMAAVAAALGMSSLATAKTSDDDQAAKIDSKQKASLSIADALTNTVAVSPPERPADVEPPLLRRGSVEVISANKTELEILPPEPAKKPEVEPVQAAKQNDPFSIEEIEAEFARLLGRTTSKDT
jgi:flagellar protein FliO/FliZ